MSLVLYAYNNSPHTATKIAPNKVKEGNGYQVLMNIQKSEREIKYPKLEIGENVRVPVIHEQH